MVKRREVDIRLYDTLIKDYIDGSELKISSIKDERYIPQLYTGCKDSDGNKIFEGDVIECETPMFTSPKKVTIKWSQSRHCFNLPAIDINKQKIKVIGNVFSKSK